jgi:uncharacterized protein YdiU (UPF0061 family)
MSVAVEPLFRFEHTFAEDLPELAEPWTPTPVPAPSLLLLNEGLAADLGLDPDDLRTDEAVAVLSGSAMVPGSRPVAQAYAGHQFGGLSPRLGDGRAALLGELVDPRGRRRDVHLKGSGRTTFARGGDGKAAVGPMLREYVVAEAMHALGIPTTRALAVVATGEPVRRETVLPGAVLTRVASSHLRVGTFQFAAMHEDHQLLRRLADHAIARHHPDLADAVAEDPATGYLAFFERVVTAQADLVARWMAVGFIHGVMNTDNTTISGETIDYGPCAFMDAHHPATVFSSIDQTGRYSYGNQPGILQWNLARLAEAMLPLFAAEPQAAVDRAVEVLDGYRGRYLAAQGARFREKLGLVVARADRDADDALVEHLLELLAAERADHTTTFRALSDLVRGEATTVRAGLAAPAAFDAWATRYLERITLDPRPRAEIAAAMDAVNPVYVPRNHLVEEALAAATAGDLEPVQRLVTVLDRPFEPRPGLERYAQPDPAGSLGYRTFCGT